MKRSMAFVEARRQKILETLAANPECKVQDLADAQNVSTLTIRRDLDALARRGFLKRFYGGAALAETVRRESRRLHSRRRHHFHQFILHRAADAGLRQGAAHHHHHQ